MESKRFRCQHCKKLKPTRVPGQRYCGDKACQQSRKNEWRRETYANDLDYRLNQKESTAAWLEKQGGAASYHREYRLSRRKQREHEEKESSQCEILAMQDSCAVSGAISANRDVMPANSLIETGRYVIFSERAKRDAYLVEIRLISSG